MKERIKQIISEVYVKNGRNSPRFYVIETSEGYSFTIMYQEEDVIDMMSFMDILNDIYNSLANELCLRKQNSKSCKKFHWVDLVPFEWEGT